jgi:hypothetical protein
MNLTARLSITVLAVAGLIVSETSDPEGLNDEALAEDVHFQSFRDPGEREALRYAREAVALLKAGDFDALEAQARRAREEKLRFANGAWQLSRFYSAMTLADSDPDSAWQERLDLLDAWLRVHPSSLTASIARAEACAAYAWKARSAGGAGEISEENALQFRERLETALHILENARSLGVNDPHYWRVAHAVAVGLDWPAANLEEIHKQALALEPEYWSNDVARLSMLLARSDRATDSFPAAIAKAAAGCNEEMYARIAWEVNQLCGSFLEATPFDWDRVEAGYRALLRRHPGSTDLLSQYCVLACRARDKDAARRCFARLAGKADLHAFGTPREYYRSLRWANWN